MLRSTDSVRYPRSKSVTCEQFRKAERLVSSHMNRPIPDGRRLEGSVRALPNTCWLALVCAAFSLGRSEVGFVSWCRAGLALSPGVE